MKSQHHYRTHSGSEYVWSPMCGTFWKATPSGKEYIFREVDTISMPTTGDRLRVDGIHEPTRKYMVLTTSPIVDQWHQTDDAEIAAQARWEARHPIFGPAVEYVG